jgi:hypothetical protein
MVSDKDIKAHEGLVRCGNCYSVFNSSWNLTDDPRSDFVGENINLAELNPSANQNKNFTFSLLGKNAALPQASENDSDQSERIGQEVDELEHQQASEDAANNLEHHDDDLEPFPEPDIGDDFHTITPEPEAKKDDESLLYFDSDNEEDEEPEELVAEENDKPVAIEDLTILQTPSFTSDIPSLERDDLLQAESGGGEPVLDTLTEDSMWPGAEVSFESAEDDIDLGIPEAEMSDANDGVLMLSDFTIDEALLDDQFEDKPSLDTALTSEQLDVDSQAEELLLPESFMAEDPLAEQPVASEALNDDSVADELLHAKDGLAQGSKGDHTLVVPGEYAKTDEHYSIDSLPDSTDEAFALDDEKENLGAESVFITSEDEVLDESYVPITLKDGGNDELLHDLDEFPEPGELQDLNYEDTMEINAMLEAANISKQQIESALHAAEIAGEEGDEAGSDEMASGEAMLSQDADIDLTEALYPSEEQSSESISAAIECGQEKNMERTGNWKYRRNSTDPELA